MEIDLMKLDFLVVKQAIRDVASKDEKLSNQALSYFISDDFKSLCFRNKINLETVHKSIKELNQYPLLSRKKLANDIAKVIDNRFVGGVLSR
jgi:hypothetical protein|tara:strand:- start:302 stop:577 length:276 start_codon:yes stop_codon:yes gene_type:complete